MIKICEFCKEEFDADKRIQRWCSRQCSNSSRDTSIIKNCKICNTEFNCKKCHIEIKKTCSKQCSQKYLGLILTGRKYGPRKHHKKLIECKCLHCQIIFTKQQCRINVGEGKYCSRICANKSKVGKMSKENNPNYKGGKEINCLICNKEFWIQPSHFKKKKTCSKTCANILMGTNNKYKKDTTLKSKINKKTVRTKECQCYFCYKTFIRNIRLIKEGQNNFCSRQCSAKFIGKRSKLGINNPNYGKGNKIKGDKNPNWRGGSTEINQGPRFTNAYKKWRLSVLKRDGRKCVFCGSTENLEADHIKPFAEYPELRLEIDNGRTLCNSCHRKTPTYGARKKKDVSTKR